MCVKERELNHNMVHKKEFSRAQELDADENKKKPLDFFVPVQTGICLDELNRQKKTVPFSTFLKNSVKVSLGYSQRVGSRSSITLFLKPILLFSLYSLPTTYSSFCFRLLSACFVLFSSR